MGDFLAYSYVPAVEPDIEIHEENMILDLAEPFAVETIFRNGQPITAVVPSSGWGPGGTGDAMLYIMLKDGTYTWAGLLASQDNYLAPDLEEIAPPPGLIYRQGDEWWRINQAGELEYMFTHTGTLSLNNSGTLALYAETSDQQLTLFHLPTGESETIAVDGTLLHGSWQMPWLDEETAVLIVGLANQPVDQQSMGNLTTLNVLDGTVVTLPPSLSVFDQPSTTGNGGILYNSYNDADQQYNLTLWQDGHEQTVALDSILTFNGTVYENPSVYAPVMSPDGRFVVGVRGDGYGRYTFAYVLTDLTNQTSTFIHFFIPLPTDAVLPWGIHWSPNSQWVALDPQSGDFFANSIQLVSLANPHNNMTLEGITSAPFWLDDWRLIFKQFTGDQTRWRDLDLRTGEQFWVDLPDGAEVVHYVPTN